LAESEAKIQQQIKEDTLSSQVFLRLHLAISSSNLYAHFLDCGWILNLQADDHNVPLLLGAYYSQFDTRLQELYHQLEATAFLLSRDLEYSVRHYGVLYSCKFSVLPCNPRRVGASIVVNNNIISTGSYTDGCMETEIQSGKVLLC
jgi:hypothetical protein